MSQMANGLRIAQGMRARFQENVGTADTNRLPINKITMATPEAIAQRVTDMQFNNGFLQFSQNGGNTWTSANSRGQTTVIGFTPDCDIILDPNATNHQTPINTEINRIRLLQGGTIILREGVYRTNGAIIARGSHANNISISIIGMPGYSTIIIPATPGTAAHGCMRIDEDNTHIENLYFFHPTGENTTTGLQGGVLRTPNTAGAQISNVYVKNIKIFAPGYSRGITHGANADTRRDNWTFENCDILVNDIPFRYEGNTSTRENHRFYNCRMEGLSITSANALISNLGLSTVNAPIIVGCDFIHPGITRWELVSKCIGAGNRINGIHMDRADQLSLADNAAGVVGTSNRAARQDHRHPANVDNVNPAALGTAAPGTSAIYARRDHVHALPTAVQVGAVPNRVATCGNDADAVVRWYRMLRIPAVGDSVTITANVIATWNPRFFGTLHINVRSADNPNCALTWLNVQGINTVGQAPVPPSTMIMHSAAGDNPTPNIVLEDFRLIRRSGNDYELWFRVRRHHQNFHLQIVSATGRQPGLGGVEINPTIELFNTRNADSAGVNQVLPAAFPTNVFSATSQISDFVLGGNGANATDPRQQQVWTSNGANPPSWQNRGPLAGNSANTTMLWSGTNNVQNRILQTVNANGLVAASQTIGQMLALLPRI